MCILPHFPVADFFGESSYCLFAIFRISQSLDKPQFPVLYELGIVSAARYPSVITMYMP